MDVLNTCPICFEDLKDRPTASPDICDHIFCLKCLQKWAKHGSFCPVDRKRFSKIVDLSTSCAIQIKPKVRKKVRTLYDITTICEVCSVRDNGDTLIFCDCCDLCYHRGCLTPPLASIPAGLWNCPVCVAVGEKLKSRKGLTKDLETIVLDHTNQGYSSSSASTSTNSAIDDRSPMSRPYKKVGRKRKLTNINKLGNSSNESVDERAQRRKKLRRHFSFANNKYSTSLRPRNHMKRINYKISRSSSADSTVSYVENGIQNSIDDTIIEESIPTSSHGIKNVLSPTASASLRPRKCLEKSIYVDSDSSLEISSHSGEDSQIMNDLNKQKTIPQSDVIGSSDIVRPSTPKQICDNLKISNVHSTDVGFFNYIGKDSENILKEEKNLQHISTNIEENNGEEMMLDIEISSESEDELPDLFDLYSQKDKVVGRSSSEMPNLSANFNDVDSFQHNENTEVNAYSSKENGNIKDSPTYSSKEINRENINFDFFNQSDSDSHLNNIDHIDQPIFSVFEKLGDENASTKKYSVINQVVDEIYKKKDASKECSSKISSLPDVCVFQSQKYENLAFKNRDFISHQKVKSLSKELKEIEKEKWATYHLHRSKRNQRTSQRLRCCSLHAKYDPNDTVQIGKYFPHKIQSDSYNCLLSITNSLKKKPKLNHLDTVILTSKGKKNSSCVPKVNFLQSGTSSETNSIDKSIISVESKNLINLKESERDLLSAVICLPKINMLELDNNGRLVINWPKNKS